MASSWSEENVNLILTFSLPYSDIHTHMISEYGKEKVKIRLTFSSDQEEAMLETGKSLSYL